LYFLWIIAYIGGTCKEENNEVIKYARGSSLPPSSQSDATSLLRGRQGDCAIVGESSALN